MKTLLRQGRLAGLATAVLVSTAAMGARADEDDAPPPAETRAPTTRSVTIVSTETSPNITPPTTPSAPLPALPNAAPPADPTMPGDATASSEPPAPSEYNQAADTDPAALNDFRDTLSPYGTWEDDSTYGVVWVPSSGVVGSDFAPYVSHGHWGLAADNSWLWVSDFNWGWAPFHYGRWVWIGGRGWGWIPGRVYSSAWVVWRTGFYDDYYVGWAPMPPTWYWRGGWAVRMGIVPPAPYVFCSASYVFAPHLRPHIAPPARMNLIAPRTRPYIAATPGMGTPGHSSMTMTRGPSLNDAHVPVGSIPAQRTSPDSRAVSFARMHEPSRTIGTSPGGFGPRTEAARPGYPSTQQGAYGPRPMSPSSGYGPRPMAPSDSYGPRPVAPGDAYGPRPVAPGDAYGPRPLPPTGASMPRYDVPRGPVMPTMPRAAPVSPSPMMPRYGAPSSPAPVFRPSMPSPSPAPVVRPSAPPAANVGRPSMSVPRGPSIAPRSAPSPRIISR